MTALDRALIKAYRADIRGSAAGSTASGFLRAAHTEDRDDLTPEVVVHASEPVLQGPHFRIKRNDETLKETSSVREETSIGPTVALAASFRVDVGIASPSPNVRLTYSPDSVTEQKMPPEPYLLRKHKAEVVSRVSEQAEEATSTVHLTSRPLNSFTEAQDTPDDTKPQLVVDAFAWTDTCEQLCQRNRGIFDGFLTELLSQITAGRKRIGFVGLDTAAGGTTVTLCLARLLAAKGLRTVVVDADFEHPQIADHLGVCVSEGWNAALAGNLPLAEVLIESLADRLTLAPLCEAVDAQALLVSSLRTSLVWKMLSEPHEVVLVDCGSTGNDRATQSLKQLTQVMPLDALYAIYDKQTTTPQELVNGTRHLKDLGLNLLGTIENFIEE